MGIRSSDDALDFDCRIEFGQENCSCARSMRASEPEVFPLELLPASGVTVFETVVEFGDGCG